MKSAQGRRLLHTFAAVPTVKLR